jgi:putative membrane protein
VLVVRREFQPRSQAADESASPRSAHTTEHLANERTFLAWIRTSLAIIGLGFVMAKFSVWLRQFVASIAPAAKLPHAGVSLPAGLTLIAYGAIVAALAYRRFVAVERAIESGRYLPARGLALLVTGALILVSLAVVAYLLASAPSIGQS